MPNEENINPNTSNKPVAVELEDGTHFYDPVTEQEIPELFEPLDFGEWDGDEEEDWDDEDDNQDNDNRREKEDNDGEDGEDKTESEDTENPNKNGEGPEGPDGEANPNPAGEGAPEGAGNLAEGGAEAAGEAGAEAAEVAAESAATAAAETAAAEVATAGAAEAAVAASPVGWIAAAVGAVIIIVVIAVIIFMALMGYTKDSADASTDCSAGGTTIVLDPGHISENDVDNLGEPSPASNVATNTNTNEGGVPDEYKYTWKVANSIKPKLESLGYTVILTRTAEDEFKSNKARSEIANAANATILLRLHHDSSANSGFFFVYPDVKGDINKAGEVTGPDQEVLDESKVAGQKILDASKKGIIDAGMPLHSSGGLLPESIYAGNAAKNGGALRGTIFSKVPVALIELGSLKNSNDTKLLGDDTFIDKAATALADGLAAYVGTPTEGSSSILFPVKGTREAHTGDTKGTASATRAPQNPLSLPAEADWFHQWPVPANTDTFGENPRTSTGYSDPGWDACRKSRDGTLTCGRGHAGVDIYAREGTPVIAPEDGKITEYTTDAIASTKEASGGGYGRRLKMVGASGNSFVFGHLMAFSEEVLKGVGLNDQPEEEQDKTSGLSFEVKAGDIIAYVGRTGGVQNTHLHFEVHDSTGDIDPVPFLDGSGGGGCGDAQSIIDKAIYFVNNQAEYAKVQIPDYDITDCGGFVATTIKEAGVDPDFATFAVNNRAKSFINYFKEHPEKYEIIGENITDTSLLQPGDILTNSKYGSHAAIFLGDKATDGNKAEASLGGHPPEFGNWYSELHNAVRIK